MKSPLNNKPRPTCHNLLSHPSTVEISTDMMTDAPAPTRMSSRVRNKSARAMESESTEKLLAAGRGPGPEKEASAKREGEDEDTAGTSTAAAGEVESGRATRATRSRAPAAETKKPAPRTRKSKYCVCKEHKTGSMIECAECVNWCVSKSEEDLMPGSTSSAWA